MVCFFNPMASFKKINNLYVWGIKGIVFLMPFIPLYVTPSIVFPYITGKNFAFRIMVELAAAFWLGLISTSKEYRLRSSPMILTILAFAFIAGLADLFGVNPYKSFWSNYERMEGFITILHLALYFIIIKSVLRTKRDWKIFFNICVVVSVLVSLHALIAPQLSVETSRLAWEYGARISGTIGNPPFLASYLLLSVFLCAVLIVNTQKLYLKLSYLVPIIINSITIYFSASRGAILSAVLGAIIVGLFYFLGKSGMSREKLIKKTVLSVVIISVILSVAFLALRDTQLIRRDITLSRFANIFSDASVQTRLSAWEMAWNGIKQRPVLGWGQENYLAVYTVNPLPFDREPIWVDRAHNIILDWLVNAGIMGLISYLAIFGAAFYILLTAVQKKTVSINETLIIGTALTVYFVHNLFTFDTINTYLLFFTLLGYVDSLGYAANLSGVKSESIINLKGMKIKSLSAALLALLVFSGVAYSINYRPMKESKLFIRMSSKLSNVDSFDLLLKNFTDILSLQTFGDSLVRKGMKDVSDYILRRDLYKMEGAPKFIEATMRELEKEIAANPYNLEDMSNTIFTYMQIAKYEPSSLDRAESLARQGMRLNPEYERMYMTLADVYFLKKDYALAFSNVKKIADRAPQSDKRQFKLALAGILVSKDNVVSGALEEIRKIRTAKRASGYQKKSYLSFFELYTLAQTYNEAGNYQRALQYYKETINLFPEAIRSGDLTKNIPENEAKIHFEMAKVYFAVGDKANALKEALKAAELDPENFQRTYQD